MNLQIQHGKFHGYTCSIIIKLQRRRTNRQIEGWLFVLVPWLCFVFWLRLSHMLTAGQLCRSHYRTGTSLTLVILDTFKLVQLRPHPCPLPRLQLGPHYTGSPLPHPTPPTPAHTVGKWAIGIRLKCLLVLCVFRLVCPLLQQYLSP